MLSLAGVEVWRGASPVLRSLDLTVGTGEIVALLGANGAGKTSTVLTVSGLLRPRAGRLTLAVDGRVHDLARLAPDAIVGLGVAHCPEGRQIFQGLTVAENLMVGAHLRRDGDVIADLEAQLELFPILKERLQLPAGQLSGGEQMMLAVGRALMSRPRLLLLDEPSLGLAPQLVDQVFDVLVEINRRGTTILLIEQNAVMALEIAQRAYVLEGGRVVLAGTAAELAADSKVREAYLGLPAAAS